MAYETGDPKMDALLLKHADEIRQLEALGKEKAAEIDRLIAKIEARRTKSTGVSSAR